MAFRYEIRLSGSGGQGIILISKILAEAAAVYQDLNATQSQSYGPEARGGTSRAEVIISDEIIDFPKAENLDLLLAMTQESVNAYINDLKVGGILVVDTTYVKNIPSGNFKVVSVDITGTAIREFGKSIVANIIALGVIIGVSKKLKPENVMEAILTRVPRGTEELNAKAFRIGLEMGAKELAKLIEPQK